MLSKATRGKSRRSLIWKFVPPEYLYKNPRIHRVTRGEIVFDLDLSNYNDFYLFYGLPEFNLGYLFSFVRPDFVVLDIGANIGFTTLNFANHCRQGFVYGYEPDSLSFNKLKGNLSLNHFSNVIINRKGLGETTAELRLVTINRHHTGMNRILSPSTIDYESEKIEVVRVDDEVTRLNIKNINLMKIDVEGYEWNVLQGAVDSIQKFRPILFIELIEKNLRHYGHSSETLVKWVQGLGYRVVDAHTKAAIPEGRWDQLETDILCLPIS
jgi:FkbM family methyltransferase